MRKIEINTEAVEMMIFYWTSVAEREKVAEPYILSVADRPEMKLLYDEEFNEESVRRVLSAISNSELLNGGSAKEKRFWNNNMWMIEDLSVMQAMVEPMKKLNLMEEAPRLSTKSGLEDVEVVFVPGTTELYKVEKNKLVINFFKIQIDVFGGTGAQTMNGKPFKEAVLELIASM